MSVINAINLNGTTYSIGGAGMTEETKQSLLTLAEKVAYVDADGQDYYDALYAALYPPANLSYITAVYTQSGTVYETDSLNGLKADLVVMAHMNDSSTQTVTAYTLSGTLTVGTSTITVSYGGKTTTFNVTVTAVAILYPLDDGTHTYTNGRSLTTTAEGHVKYTNTSSASSGTGYYGNLSDLDANDNTGTSNTVYTAGDVEFVLHAGDAIRFVISNIAVVQTPVQANKTFTIAIQGITGDLWSYTDGDTSGLAEKTVEADVTVKGLVTYARNSWSSLEYDVELYVNNVRYI